MIRRAALGLVAGLLAIPAGIGPVPPAQARAADLAAIELVAQSPLASPGSTFVLKVRLTAVPADGQIDLIAHQRVRSRSELETSIAGQSLRTKLISTVTPIATLPTAADGSRQLTLSLDPSAGGLRLPAAGVYPLEVVARDSANAAVATLVTHLIVPDSGTEAPPPPLHVAVVARIGAPPALRPDGTSVLDRTALGDVAGLVGALRAAPDVPVSLAVGPETIDALDASPAPGDAELVDGVRLASAQRTVLSQPYVHVSPDALAAAGLLGELERQVDRGRQQLADALGQPPTSTTWLAGPDLGAAGLAALPALGVQHVVVDPSQVAALPAGLLDLSLAQRFSLAPPDDGGDGPDPVASNLDAIALDPIVLGRLAAPGSPALVAARVLTELAVIRFEQPGVERGVVLPVDSSTDAAAVLAILRGLATGTVFDAVTLDGLFASTRPLVDGGDNPVVRSLTPASATTLTTSEADAVRRSRRAIGTFRSLVGPASPRPEPLDQHLLVATSDDLTTRERRAHLTAVASAVDAVASKVTGPDRFTLTLTARSGTIPLTLRNDAGVPLRVLVNLRSAKLAFPKGSPIALTLTEPSTRIDIPVEALASGAFLLEIEVTSPDGQRPLVMSRYTVRSTAVAGAGLVLSIGAGLFLAVWWARHWRRTRRSAKLVASGAHPAAREAAPAE